MPMTQPVFYAPPATVPGSSHTPLVTPPLDLQACDASSTTDPTSEVGHHAVHIVEDIAAAQEAFSAFCKKSTASSDFRPPHQ